MARGGKREGAGRPATGVNTIKIRVQLEDRDRLNQISNELGISVNKFINLVLDNPKMKNIIDDIKKI